MSYTPFNTHADALAKYPAEEANTQHALHLVQRHPSVRSLLTFFEETHRLWSADATQPNPWPFAATVATIVTRSNDPVRFANNAHEYARVTSDAGIQKVDLAIALRTLEALQELQRLDPVGTAHWTPVTGYQLGNKPNLFARWPLLVTERPGAVPVEVGSIHDYTQANRVVRVLNGDVAAANELRDELYRRRMSGQGFVEAVVDDSPDEAGLLNVRAVGARGAGPSMVLAAACDSHLANRINDALNGELPTVAPSTREVRLADLLRSTLGTLQDLKDGFTGAGDVVRLVNDAAELGVHLREDIPELQDDAWSQAICAVAGITLVPENGANLTVTWEWIGPTEACERSYATATQAADAAIEHHFPRDDWQHEVSAGDTSRSYAEWVLSKAEQLADEAAYEAHPSAVASASPR